jgi:hypothetical protein
MLWEEVFGKAEYASIATRLGKPVSGADVVLDTDAYNEIDDQFALAYLVRSEPFCRVRAMTAAPFYSHPSRGRAVRSDSPADGMERSYREILKVLALMDRDDLNPFVFRGSPQYLPGPLEPVRSEAAGKIIEISKDYDAITPLYVVAIGALTNVASALLMDTTLRDRIVVVWLGGHARHYHMASDFNLEQDVDAARVVFGCGVPLVQLPCLGVVSEFRFSKAELEHLFRGKNALCDYLIDNTFSYMNQPDEARFWSKPLWDVAAVAWLMPGDMMLDRILPAMIPQADFNHSYPLEGPPIRYVYYVKKDALTNDLVTKLCQ